jgi:type II secretory pathway component PulF
VTTTLSVNITEFIGELVSLLESDISCSDALKIVQQGQENLAMQQLISAIIADVENEISLADSFAQYPRYFEPFLVEMLHKEEQNQAAILMKIAKYRESMDADTLNLTKKIASSSIYSWYLLLVFFVVTIFKASLQEISLSNSDTNSPINSVMLTDKVVVTDNSFLQ